MANNDKLWFELGVRDNITKELERILNTTNDLAKAISIIGKEPIMPGFKDSYDNVAKLKDALTKIGGALSNLKSAKLKIVDPKDLADINKMQLALGRMRAKIDRFITDMSEKPGIMGTKGLAEGFLSTIGYDTALSQVSLKTSQISTKTKEYAQSQKLAAQATKESAQVNKDLVNTYNEIAKSGKNVNIVVNQMQQQLASITSLYGMERLLKSVITIGGQFEFQHIALQNILGDIQQANTLFDQLQVLAIESPKTFMELTSYTKQLSAYQIPYNELFDTTKRLADLSTGLGVDMSRLILAYGQVRSAAVLRGQELRQFTEAGIPLVQKLAEEFTKLNGKVTTTGDVFELISKRAVPFEMIKKILWDMTSEGGQFYNMQAELADTLYGKWQKLQDQWQITLGHIADGEKNSGKFLKTTIEGVVKLVSLFDTLLPLFGAFAAGRFTNRIFNKGAGIYKRYTGQAAIDNMQIAKEREAVRLERERLMYGKQLNVEEQKLVRYKNQLVASDMKLLLLQGEITEKQLVQLANAGKLNKLEVYRLLRAQGYTLEQYKQIKNGNLQILQGGGSFMGNMLKGGWNMLGGWMGVATTAIGAYLSLQSNASQKTDEAVNAAKGASEEMLKDLKEINALYNELSTNTPKNVDEISSAIERMSNSLKASGGYTEDLQKELEGVTDVEKYEILYRQLEKVSAEYLKMKDNVEAYLEAANRVGEGNWFTRMFKDPMSKDLKDLSNANREKKVAKAQADRMGAALKEELKRMLQDSGEWKEVQNSWSWDMIFGNLTERQVSDFKFLIGWNTNRQTKEGKQYWIDLLDLVQKYSDALYKVRDEREEVEKQMPESVDYWYMALEEKASLNNIVLDKLGEDGKEEDIRKVNNWINDIVSSMHLDPETAEMVRKKILERLPNDLKVRIETLPVLDNSNLSEWQKQIDKYFKDNKINISIDAQTSLEKVEKQLQNKKKEFQEQMERGKGILIKFGADFSNLEASIEALKKKYPFMSYILDKANSDYLDAQNGIKTIDQAGKDTGLNVDGKTNNKSGGSKQDKALEKAKTQLEEVKKFYSEYKKYRNVYGAEKGQSLVEEIFGMKSGEGNRIIKDYKAVIKGILDSLPDNNSDARKKFKLGGNQLLGEIDLDASKRQIDYALKELQEHISRQTSQWNLYKQLFEKTGSKEFAQNAFRDTKVFDEYTRSLERELEQKTGSTVIDYTMTQAAAERFFEDNKEAYELWKKIVELTSNNYTNALTKGADAMAAQLTIAEKIRKEEEEIARLRKEGAGIPGNEALIRMRQENIDKYAYEQFKQDSSYIQFFSSVMTMANDEMEQTAQIIKDKLIEALVKGAITARQYIKEVRDVNEQLEKGRNLFKGNNFMTFMTGGQKAMVDMRQEEWSNAAMQYELAVKQREALEKQQDTWDELDQEERQDMEDRLEWAREDEKKAKEELERRAEELKISEKQYLTLGKLSTALNMTTSVLSGFQQAFSGLSNMFDAIGNKDLANDMSDAAEGIGGVMSILTPVNNIVGSLMKGDISGAIGGIISAPIDIFTGPVAAFSKLFDKQNQRMIEESQERVKENQRFLDQLEKRLERTLGGIFNTNASKDILQNIKDSVRERFMANGGFLQTGYILSYIRKNNNELSSAIKEAEKSSSYYDAVYASLLSQKEELEYQLYMEKEKKNPDESVISDFKQQLFDLEDQIKYFAEDMAKALYDIDLRSWASDLTDAIVEAWENGEDAAEAYKNKVKSLMKDLTKNILTKKVLEDAFSAAGIDKMITDLMSSTKGKLDESAVTKIADALAQVGETSTSVITGILNELEKNGYIDKGDTNSSSTSGGIKSITENTADLIASYLNAIRGDVSVNRVTLYNIMVAVQSQQRLPVIAEAQLQQMQTLVTLARERNMIVGEVRDMIHRVETGQTRISVK